MTDLQKAFAEQYVIDYHITNAGKRAGIQGDNINVTAWKMLQLQDVQSYIEKLQAEAALRCQISKDEWLNEFKKIGFSNIRNYMTDKLDARDLSEVENPEVIKKVKKVTKNFESGSETTIEFELYDKQAALVNIGRHLGFFEKDNNQTKPEFNLHFDKADNDLGSV